MLNRLKRFPPSVNTVRTMFTPGSPMQRYKTGCFALGHLDQGGSNNNFSLSKL